MKVTALTKEQAIKIIKTALYIGASAIISYVITLIASNPDLFGPLTALINILLVTAKQFLTDGTNG